MEKTLLTPYQREKAERDLAIWQEWNRLVALGNAKTAVALHLQEKYNLRSVTAIYNAIKKHRALEENN